MPAVMARHQPFVNKRTASRLLGIVQLGVGAALVSRPDQLAAAAAGTDGRPAPRWLVRLLGARSLMQGAVTAAAPVHATLLLGALVDIAHAASMTPLIAASSRYRRSAAISATVATMSAGAGTLAARHTGPAA